MRVNLARAVGVCETSQHRTHALPSESRTVKEGEEKPAVGAHNAEKAGRTEVGINTFHSLISVFLNV